MVLLVSHSPVVEDEIDSGQLLESLRGVRPGLLQGSDIVQSYLEPTAGQETLADVTAEAVEIGGFGYAHLVV